jgi:hypothetical protein
MDEAVASNANPWPPIVFTAIANASEFPTLVRAGPVCLNRFPRTISGFPPGSLQSAVFAAS